jgi:hypothetical protein
LLLVAAVLVCTSAPPVRALYQRKVPEVVLLAERTRVPVPQRVPFVVVGWVAGELAFTVAVTAVRVALSQLMLLVIVT